MNYLEYLLDGDVVSKWYLKAKKFSFKDLFKKSEEQTSEGDNNNNIVYKRKVLFGKNNPTSKFPYPGVW